MQYPDAHEFETTMSALCLEAFDNSPDRPLIRFKVNDQLEDWTVGQLMHRAHAYANRLLAADIKPGDPVAVMLDNHPDHVAVMIALALTGAIWLPLDRRFTASNVRRVLSQVEVAVAILESTYADTVREGGFQQCIINRLDVQSNHVYDHASLKRELHAFVSENDTDPDDTRALLFTSGTTGQPKGVIVTERMYIASSLFCGYASEADEAAIFYLWEPLNHIGGAQIIPMALLSECTIAMTTRFSVSRFWTEVIEMKASRIHYLGGVLDLLLTQEPTLQDQQHAITLGFGAGASEQVRRVFLQRFGIPLREVYGMTEASSFTSMNFDGPLNSIGKPLRDFDLVIADADGLPVETGETGEITIKPTRCDLITPGYFKNEAATKSAFRDGYFCTGDLAWQDMIGNLYFVGRKKEMIRSKGENISATEIESVFKQHPAVVEVAVIGVESDTTEQDIVAYIRLTKLSDIENRLARDEIRTLLNQELAAFQRPKYIVELDQFPKTPSKRIEKHKLDRSAEMLMRSWS